MNAQLHRRWYPAFVIYRWWHVLLLLPLLALSGFLVLHWNQLRVDHALTVVQLRPTTAVLAGRPVAAWVSEQIDIIRSDDVLGPVGKESGLATAWGMGEAEAVEALRHHVICESIAGTSLIELKVRKFSGADALAICKSITKHAGERLEIDLAAETARLAAKRLTVAKKAAADLEAKLAAAHAKFMAEAPHDGHGVEIAARFESLVEIQADRRLLEQLKQQIAAEEMGGCALMFGPLIEHEAAHWPRMPALYHLDAMAIAACWTLCISVLVAIVLAYLLEGMIPRKPRADIDPGTLLPANE